jgi:hypothetical protein
MRTSLDLPDETFRDLKMLAVQRGVTLKELLRTVVESELARARSSKPGRRVKFPILGSKEPGTLDLTNAEIEELLT